MDGNGDDPFASLAHLCILSDSQEDILRRCPFAGDPKTLRGFVSSEPTGIFMGSLPERLEQREQITPHDASQTPPKQSVPAGSGGQRSLAVDDPDVVAVAAGTEVVVESGCMGDDAMGVYLGKNTDLGFPPLGMPEIQRIGARGSKGPVSASKRLKLSDEALDTASSGPIVVKKLLVDLDSTKSAGESKLMCDHNNEMTEELMTETNGGAEGCSGIGVGKVSNGGNGEETHCNNEEKLGEKEERAERVENPKPDEPSKFQETSNQGQSSRVLPSSINEAKDNAEKKSEETEATPFDMAMPSILGILKFLSESNREEEDDSLANLSILDIVMRRGMTFPRPCWWPEDRQFSFK